MGTYDHKQVIADYTKGCITLEMATGHSLQHIDKLYQAQATTSANRRELRNKIKHLEDMS